MQFIIKLAAISSTAATAFLFAIVPMSAFGQPSGPAAGAAGEAKAASRSSLPEIALEKARIAEQSLAANKPEKAIEILKKLDEEYPGHSAISLRLAEIHDTLNRYGHALFYYRRYIQLAGARTREMAAARVQSLELMPGIDDDAAAAAKELGEVTKPVATPTPMIKRMLAAAREDGSLVPLTSEKDLANIRKLTQGSASPIPSATPALTPIIIPEMNRAKPVPSPTPVAPAPSEPPSLSSTEMSVSAPADPIIEAASAPATTPTRRPAQAKTPSAGNKVDVYAGAKPKADQDALMAQAFLSTDSTDEGPLKPIEMIAVPSPTPEPKTIVQTPKPLSAIKHNSEDKPARLTGNAPVAYTSSTPSTDSPRAASFFNIGKVSGKYAVVVILNNLQDAVVTMSVVPPDDGEVLSAILMPGETKTLYVKPGRFQVKANASTTDYSPITLMDTSFQYKFEAGKQYTKRITKDSLQRVN